MTLIQIRRSRLLAPVVSLTLSTVLSTSSPAASAVDPRPAHERLTELAMRSIDVAVADDPVVATDIGLPGHDGDLVPPTEARRAAAIARLQSWKRELAAIEQAAGANLSLADADDAKLLRAQFDGQLADALVRQCDRKSYAAATLRLTGAIFTQFLHLPVPGREGATSADLDRAWADIASRLSKGSGYIVAGQRLVTRPGHLAGVVGSQQLAGTTDFLGGALTDAARGQLAHDPAAFERFAAARDAVLATVASTKAYIDAHVSSWPENHAIGKAAYDRMLRDEQLLPYDSADVERIGRDALAHGWAEEAWLASLSKERKLPFGAASGGGMAPGGPALVDYYRDRLAELKQFVQDHDLVTIPAWLGSMEIVETPPFLQPISPGASMNPPRLFSPSTTGYYFITPPKSLDDAAARLDMNEDFDRDRIWSTGAHEAMPGHFFQLSIARRHPDYVRKIANSGVFDEGWAFYGEEMFVRLGLYGDDLDARLFTARWERVRGARAIVDTKLASGEWSVDRAARFFEEQSGFTKGAAEAAVRGIALGPGYVIAYTVGRLQLETLLGEYQRRTGDRGSLRDFHDRLLSYGSVPFSILGPELLADLDEPAATVRERAGY